MLAGVHPFRKIEAMETVGAILHAEPAPLARYREEVSEILQHMLRKMLAKDPADRYQSVHEVHTNLRALSLQALSRETAPPVLEGKPRTVTLGPKRSVLLLSALGLVAVVAMLLWERQAELSPAPAVNEITGTEKGAKSPESLGAREPEVITPSETTLALGVAVLPFENLSPDPDNAFFAAGVHDDVLTYLSRVSALRVISRTSVATYAGGDLTLPEIARKLGVSHVMAGSVRRAGSRVRVTVRLIEAVTDEHVWAKNYDRTLHDILAIQTEIAQTVVARVEAELTPQEAMGLAKIPTASTEAYDEYLRGLQLRNTQRVRVSSPDHDSDGISEHLLRATQLDRDFLAAWLMTMEVSSAAFWFNRDPDRRHLQRVRSALERIQALAPDSPESDLATGFHYYYITRDIRAAFAAFQRATAARPNDTQGLRFLAAAARRLEHWDTMVNAMRRVVLLDPANPRNRKDQISHLADSTDYAAAIAVAAEAIQRFPEEAWFRVFHAVLVARHTGDVTLCRRVMDDVPPENWLNNRFFFFVSLVRGVFSNTEQAIAWIEAADPASDSFARAPLNLNFCAGIHLLVGGDTEGARLRFKAAYAQFSARLDGAHELHRSSGMGFLSRLAALAGEHAAALEYRQLALAYVARTDDDVMYRNQARQSAAHTLAVLGDVDEAWSELQPLIRKPRCPTEWDLALRYDISHFFADSKGYQARVARLEARERVSSPK